MRAFSTIEILLALAIMTTTVVAVTLITLGMPIAIAQARLEYAGYQKIDGLLQKNSVLARANFDAVTSIATTTDGIYEVSLEAILLSDEITKRLTARAHWINARGLSQDISLSVLVTDPNNIDESHCSGSLLGDWSTPVVLNSYSVTPGGLLPLITPYDQYPVSDVALGSGLLALAIDATVNTSSPELFVFKIDSFGGLVPYGGGHDNAPASRFGFSGVVIHKGKIFAANSFGSGSNATCKVSHNCDQLQIFSSDDPHTSTYLSSLQLATTAPPFAVSSGGISAGAKSIVYKKGFVYLGLVKTITGSEFNIIDVSDPQSPVWKGGARVGRTINHISVSGSYAYLATDDNARELMVFDIRDPANPTLIGSWNAPGGVGFGYGTASAIQNENIYFGRSYVSNAPELVMLSGHDVSSITEIGSRDIGTRLNPESIRDLAVRDFLTFVLTDSKLQIWETEDPATPLLYGEVLPFSRASTATSLACKNNSLYIGGYENTGNVGHLSIITSS